MNKKNVKIAYMGTPLMSAQVLECLIKEGYNVVCVIAQIDKINGRNNKISEVPTKTIAKKYNIPVYQPIKIRNDYEFLTILKPDLIITMAYGQIIPKEVLQIPNMGCINFHGSLLPSYRGAAPIQRSLMNGDCISGVTLMKMEEKMDSGEMYCKKEVLIEDYDNFTSLSEKIIDACKYIIKNNLEDFMNKKLKGEEQNEADVTFANKILPSEEHLDIFLNSKKFINIIRGLSMNPGAFLILDNKKLKIYEASLIDNKIIYPIGTLILNKKTYLQLSDGIIQVSTLQLEGKKISNGVSFANGYKKYNNIVLK